MTQYGPNDAAVRRSAEVMNRASVSLREFGEGMRKLRDLPPSLEVSLKERPVPDIRQDYHPVNRKARRAMLSRQRKGR